MYTFFIRTPALDAWRRLQKRGRGSEADIPLSYLKRLEILYDSFLKSGLCGKVYVFDGTLCVRDLRNIIMLQLSRLPPTKTRLVSERLTSTLSAADVSSVITLPWIPGIVSIKGSTGSENDYLLSGLKSAGYYLDLSVKSGKLSTLGLGSVFDRSIFAILIQELWHSFTVSESLWSNVAKRRFKLLVSIATHGPYSDQTLVVNFKLCSWELQLFRKMEVLWAWVPEYVIYITDHDDDCFQLLSRFKGHFHVVHLNNFEHGYNFQVAAVATDVQSSSNDLCKLTMIDGTLNEEVVLRDTILALETVHYKLLTNKDGIIHPVLSGENVVTLYIACLDSRTKAILTKPGITVLDLTIQIAQIFEIPYHHLSLYHEQRLLGRLTLLSEYRIVSGSFIRATLNLRGGVSPTTDVNLSTEAGTKDTPILSDDDEFTICSDENQSLTNKVPKEGGIVLKASKTTEALLMTDSSEKICSVSSRIPTDSEASQKILSDSSHISKELTTAVSEEFKMRCRETALARLMAYKNASVGNSQVKSTIELLTAQANEKFVTFGQTLELTDEQLIPEFAKRSTYVKKIISIMTEYTSLIDTIWGLQQYRNIQFDILKTYVASLFATYEIPMVIRQTLNKLSSQCEVGPFADPGFIIIPVYRKLKKQHAIVKPECSTYFSALHANNRRVLGLSTDIELDLSSVPQENILLFRPKTENNKNISSVLSLKRMEKTVEKNISSVLSLKRVETAVKKLDIDLTNNKKRGSSSVFQLPVSDKKPRNDKSKTGFYMPTGLIPLMSSVEISKALEARWGRSVNTGWLVVDEIGEQQEYETNKYINIAVRSARLLPDEQTRLRIKVSLPIPCSFPIDALVVGNRIRSKRCKIFNKGKGYATISIIDATFVVDSAHKDYRPFVQDNNDEQ